MSSLEFPFRDAPAPGTARKIAPGVHWLRMALPFALDHINLWLLEDGDGVARFAPAREEAWQTALTA